MRSFETDYGIIKFSTPCLASEEIFYKKELEQNKKFDLDSEIEISFNEKQKKTKKMFIMYME